MLNTSALENTNLSMRPTLRNHSLVQWTMALFKEKVVVGSPLSSLAAK